MSKEVTLEEERCEVEAPIAGMNYPRPPSGLAGVRSSFSGEDTMGHNRSIIFDELSIEELSDFEENDMDSRDDVIAPHVIEYAESGLSESHIEGYVIKDLHDLNFDSPDPDPDPLSDSSNVSDDEYQKIIREQRAYDRFKRRALRSMGSRAMSERSDSESEDIQHKLHPGQAGSAARRLKRRVGDPRSPIFQDPPSKVDEMVEPLGELEDGGMPKTELPFYALTITDQDSPSTSTYKVSRIPPSSFQNAEGDDRDPEGKESLRASSSLGLESDQPRSIGEDTEVAHDEEDIPSDRESAADETRSTQSYTDSVFDADSVGSSASSVYSDTQALVGEYVDFLVRDPGLEKLFMRAMLPTVLGPERFRRNYSRILQSYARDLKRHMPVCNEPTLRTQALAFISRRSITMKAASIIASRYMEKVPKTQFHSSETEDENVEVLDGNETSSGDESPCTESNYTLMISEIGQYLREGAPFQRMKRNLRNLVIPSALLSNVNLSTERILDRLFSDEYLRSLLFGALKSPSVRSRDRFDPVREISYFSSRLMVQAPSPGQFRVAEFLDTYAEYIGTRVVQRMEGMHVDAILEQPWENWFLKYGDEKRCKIILDQPPAQTYYMGWLQSLISAFNRVRENNRSQRTPRTSGQAYMERLRSLIPSFSGLGKKKNRSRETSQIQHGHFSAWWMPVDHFFAIGVGNLFTFLIGGLMYTLHVVAKNVVDLLDQHHYLLSGLVVYMFMNIFFFVIFITTAGLLSYSRNVFEDSWLGPVRGLSAFRYFEHEWIHSGHQPRSYLWQTYLSSKAEEVLEAAIDGNLPNICDGDIHTHWPGVASSEAFKEFIQKLRDAAAPTFFSEARRLVTQGLVGDEDTNADADKASLLCALDELQWCFMQTGVAPIIRISTLKSSCISDLAKLAIEASSQSEWQWWPLQPPSSRGKARGTECRMSWKCNCGTDREEIVSFAYAFALTHLAHAFPLSNEPLERPPSSLSDTSSQATGTTSGSEGNSTGSGAVSTAGSSSLGSVTDATSPSSSVISFGTPPKAFVFLVVKAARYTLAPIDVTEKKARDFFQAIVETYNQKRGWRRLLSIYVYSHCDFVKMKRYAPQSFDPGVRFSFPPHDESPHDKEYGYYPRPMHHAPVSRHMFNHLFNACYSDKGLAHKLHFGFIAPSCIIKSIPGKLLDGMPKRDRLVDDEAEFSEDQDVEVFWGLVAREQRSALRVVMYMILGLGPSLWFMFQWLFGWGHDGDLQDATVPLMFSGTMLGILGTVVYSGDDVREVEQPR